MTGWTLVLDEVRVHTGHVTVHVVTGCESLTAASERTFEASINHITTSVGRQHSALCRGNCSRNRVMPSCLAALHLSCLSLSPLRFFWPFLPVSPSRITSFFSTNWLFFLNSHFFPYIPLRLHSSLHPSFRIPSKVDFSPSDLIEIA